MTYRHLLYAVLYTPLGCAPLLNRGPEQIALLIRKSDEVFLPEHFQADISSPDRFIEVAGNFVPRLLICLIHIYFISSSLNCLIKFLCSDFARQSTSSSLQVNRCHDGLSCSGYRSSNVGSFFDILVSYCGSGCGSQVRHHFIHSTHYILNSSHSYIIFYIHLYYRYNNVFCL